MFNESTLVPPVTLCGHVAPIPHSLCGSRILRRVTTGLDNLDGSKRARSVDLHANNGGTTGKPVGRILKRIQEHRKE